MSDSESDDDLRPHQLGRREFGVDFFSDSDDDDEVRDYDSDDGFSLISVNDRLPNNTIDQASHVDFAAADGYIYICAHTTLS